MTDVSLREMRGTLASRDDLRGIAYCEAHAHAADEWIRALGAEASRGNVKGLALLAVGGYGRGELSPFSDLDLVLVHEGRRDVDDIADRLWYPIWDEGIKLDHSVRTPKEIFKVAGEDLRVALGLLDARLVWGDEEIANPVIQRVRDLWSTQWGDLWLPELESQMAVRHEQHGDLADLLEPDLKEAHGGLRDVNVLEAVRWAFPEVTSTVDFDAVFMARNVLLEARVALHLAAGRAIDRLLLQEQDQVAALTTLGDADGLMTKLSAAARIVARASDTAWRRRVNWRQRGTNAPAPSEIIEDGIELYDGEIRLSAGAPVTSDVTLTMRMAAAAALLDRPLHLASLQRLANEAPEPPTPWHPALRRAFVSLLSSGAGLVATVETLDSFDLFTRHLPEWSHVRSYHQRNAYHRFTVDRHLLETVLNTRDQLANVAHPDLLLLGALFHDIGKGLPGDHTDVGIELVQAIGPRIGLSGADAATLTQLVRHHLLLADVATRRDLDDPATIRYVAAAVGDEQTLELLSALSRADGLATGPSAWGPWKAQLVDDLVSRVRLVLQGHDVNMGSERPLSLETDVANGPVVRRDGDWLTVACEDRPGLLAIITSALALLALDIRSADLASDGGVAIDRFYCAPGPRGWPNDDDIAAAVRDALGDPESATRRLLQRAATYVNKPRSAKPVAPRAHLIPAASDASTVIEVVALDHLGLLSSLAQVVAEQGHDIAAARLSTVGEVAIDTFYLRRSGGGPLGDEDVTRLLDALSRTVGAATD